MKSFVVISTVLAASQCVPEPSGPRPSTTDVSTRADASTPDAGSAEANVDASVDPVRAADRLLKPGPAPFTVPTRRIEWAQQRATVLAPLGARIEATPPDTRVVVGDGHNFDLHLSAQIEQAVRPDEVISSTARQLARKDGMRVWLIDGHWFFRGGTNDFTCWNDLDAEHDREDVEMMIASCKSIERQP